MSFPNVFLITLSVQTLVFLVQTILVFSLPLLAYELSEESGQLALIKGVGFVPNIVFAIVIGVLNDRVIKVLAVRRYAFLLFSTVVALFVVQFNNAISITNLIFFVVALNALGYAMGNANLALIRLSVDQNRQADAMGIASMFNATVNTLGPAVGGLCLVWLGHTGVIALCVILVGCAALGTTAIRLDEKLPEKQPFWASLIEGVTVFRHNQELVFMTVVIVMTNAAEGAFATALIVKMKAVLNYNAFEIGIVLTAAGIGSIFASRYAAQIRRHFGYRAAFFWPILGLGCLYLVVINDLPIAVLCVVSFAEGALSLFFAIGIWSYRQETTDAQHVGRVAGLTGSIFKVGMPPIIILAGVLGDYGALNFAFVIATFINIVAALFLVFVAKWGWPLKRRDIL